MSTEKNPICYNLYMSDATNPESAERESIIVPKEASQLFGAYLRQEFEVPLETIGKPQNQRLINFIDELETSKRVRLVKKNGFADFEFSKEKDHVPNANNFTMGRDLTPHFLNAIDHNVRNALNLLVAFDDEKPFKMAEVLTLLRDAKELKMSRGENGKIQIIPLLQPPVIG